jgi:hypothetical protein
VSNILFLWKGVFVWLPKQVRRWPIKRWRPWGDGWPGPWTLLLRASPSRPDFLYTLTLRTMPFPWDRPPSHELPVYTDIASASICSSAIPKTPFPLYQNSYYTSKLDYLLTEYISIDFTNPSSHNICKHKQYLTGIWPTTGPQTKKYIIQKT